MCLRHISSIVPHVRIHYGNGKGQNLEVSGDFTNLKIKFGQMLNCTNKF